MGDIFTDDTIIDWGAHKGKTLANVPAKWLIWANTLPNIDSKLKHYIESNMDILIKENEKERN